MFQIAFTRDRITHESLCYTSVLTFRVSRIVDVENGKTGPTIR